MPVTYVYELHANDEQRAALQQLHCDYARLCNRLADAMREAMGDGDVVPSAHVADYQLAKMQDELKAVDEQTGNRIIPSVYIKLARNRVLTDLAEDRDRIYRGDMAVDLDEAVATPKVNKLDEPATSLMTIKLFRSGTGSRERLRVPYVVSERDHHLKPSTAKLYPADTLMTCAVIVVTLPSADDECDVPKRRAKFRTATPEQESRIAQMREQRSAE